jgi:hypothetical protein
VKLIHLAVSNGLQHVAARGVSHHHDIDYVAPCAGDNADICLANPYRVVGLNVLAPNWVGGGRCQPPMARRHTGTVIADAED